MFTAASQTDTEAAVANPELSIVRSFWQREDVLLVLLLCAVSAVLFFHLGSYGLWEPDESRYAEIAREMLNSRDFIVPHQNYVPYVEKPPLLYWLTTAFFWLFGVSEFSARLTTALFASASVFLTYWFGRRVFDRRRGLLAAAILLTCPTYAALGQTLTTDMLLTFLLSVAFFSFFVYWHQGGRCWIWFYVAIAMALLAKGPVGLVLPALAVLIFLWPVGELRVQLRRLHLWTGIAIVVILAAPWFVIISYRLPGFFQLYIVGEHLRRFFDSHYSHDRAIYYYFPVLLLGMLPWSLAFPLVLRNGTNGPARSFCLTVAATVLVFFTLSRSKLIPYILPAFPPIALLTADSILAAIDSEFSKSQTDNFSRTIFILMGLIVSCLGLGCIVLGIFANSFRSPYPEVLRWDLVAIGSVAAIGGLLVLRNVVSRRFYFIKLLTGVLIVCLALSTYGRISLDSLRSFRNFSLEIADKKPNALVVCYIRYVQALPFYLRRRVLLVGPYLAELKFGAQFSPERSKYFIPWNEDLLALWNSKRQLVLVIDQKDFARLSDKLPGAKLVSRMGRKLAISN